MFVSHAPAATAATTGGGASGGAYFPDEATGGDAPGGAPAPDDEAFSTLPGMERPPSARLAMTSALAPPFSKGKRRAPRNSTHGGRAMALPTSPACGTVLTGLTNYGPQTYSSHTFCTNGAGTTYAASIVRTGRIKAAPGYRYRASLDYYDTESGYDKFTFYTLTSPTTTTSVSGTCGVTPTGGALTPLLPLFSGTQTCGTTPPCGNFYYGLFGAWISFCVRASPP